MPGGHSVGSFVKALKQYGERTPLDLLQRAGELLQVVSHMHSDLSKDVRGRDVELFQEMWNSPNAIWLITNHPGTSLMVESGNYNLERIKKMRDRMLLDLGLSEPQHQQSVRRLHLLLQALATKSMWWRWKIFESSWVYLIFFSFFIYIFRVFFLLNSGGDWPILAAAIWAHS